MPSKQNTADGKHSFRPGIGEGGDDIFISEQPDVAKSLLKRIFKGKILGILKKGKSEELETALRTIAEKDKELSQMKSELKRALQTVKTAEKTTSTQQEVTGIIMHDLKSPLNAILGFSDLLRSGLENDEEELSPEEISTYSKIINERSHAMFAFLEKMLELLKNDFQPENVDLSQIGEMDGDVEVQMIKTFLEEKNIRLVSKIEPHTNVFADPRLVCRIMNNLIMNAAKFSKKGDSITLTATEKPTEIEIAVIDEGVGMNTETLLQLFKKPVKQAGVGTNNEKGTGLGLFLCKGFVEKMGGKIWAESEKGNGATFKFTLPKPKLLDNDPNSSRIGNGIIRKGTNVYEQTQEFFRNLNHFEIPLNHSSKEDFQELCTLGKIFESIQNAEEQMHKMAKQENSEAEISKEDDAAFLALQDGIVQEWQKAQKIIQSFIERKKSEVHTEN